MFAESPPAIAQLKCWIKYNSKLFLMHCPTDKKLRELFRGWDEKKKHKSSEICSMRPGSCFAVYGNSC